MEILIWLNNKGQNNKGCCILKSGRSFKLLDNGLQTIACECHLCCHGLSYKSIMQCRNIFKLSHLNVVYLNNGRKL